MKKTILTTLVLFMVYFSKAQTFNPLLATMLQDTLNTYVSQIPNIKGMSVGVYVPGQGIWKGVTGVSYTGQPITPDMRMGIASNSKLFVSIIMLMLAEDNILSLDDSLSAWLPNYPNVNPNIKIRQLLNHTSGISDPIFVSPWMDTINANPTRVFTPNEVLSWLGPPTFPAGTGYGYSNVNYILAGMIAKNATGFHISKLIRDSILTPLNMDSTFYDVEEPEVGVVAHRWWNNIDYHDTSRVGINSAGGCAGSMFSTAAEMVQWYNALFDGQVINQASITELTTFLPTSNPNMQYGLGFARETLQGYKYWGHGGTTWGYRSRMIYDSCLHVAVCGLSNSFPSGMDAVTFLIYRAVKNHIPGCSSAIAGLTTLCAGTNSVMYTVPPISNATSYTWTLPSGVTGISNTNSITVNFGLGAVSGNIIVQGVNNYGPGGSSSIWVTVNPIPVAPVISQNGNVLSSSAPSGNQWFNSSGIIVGSNNANYTITSNDNYYCIVTQLGCSSDTSNIINAVFTDVQEKKNSMDIAIYPNPASNYIFVKSNNKLTKDMTLNFYNALGVLVRTENINQNQQQFNILDMANGFYIVEIKSGEMSARQLLIIQ